jgi:hypothetical protein
MRDIRSDLQDRANLIEKQLVLNRPNSRRLSALPWEAFSALSSQGR